MHNWSYIRWDRASKQWTNVFEDVPKKYHGARKTKWIGINACPLRHADWHWANCYWLCPTTSPTSSARKLAVLLINMACDRPHLQVASLKNEYYLNYNLHPTSKASRLKNLPQNILRNVVPPSLNTWRVLFPHYRQLIPEKIEFHCYEATILDVTSSPKWPSWDVTSSLEKIYLGHPPNKILDPPLLISTTCFTGLVRALYQIISRLNYSIETTKFPFHFDFWFFESRVQLKCYID